MGVWCAALLLAAQVPPPGALRGAEVVFATGFEQDADSDYDAWPDGWVRRRDRGFPHYLSIGIAPDPAGDRGQCLRIELDGGAAMVSSPLIEIDPAYSYLLRARLKTERLRHDVAYVSLTVLDARRQPRATYDSPHLTHAPAWQDLQIGPLTITDPEARFAVIALHVTPTDRADLQGAAMFDDILLSQLPRVSIASRQPQNLFFDPAQVKLTCGMSGIPQEDPTLRLELLDVAGRCVDSARLSAESVSARAGDDGAIRGSPSEPARADRDQRASGGSVTWHPQVPGYGFYTLRISWPPDGAPTLQHTTSLVVLRPDAGEHPSEFGWSLPDANIPLTAPSLVALLKQAHVGWLEYPVACDPADTRALDRLAALTDQLCAGGIEPVGVLDTIPASLREQLSYKQNLTMADWLQRPGLWQPAIEPWLSRLASKMRHWRIGDEAISRLADLEKLVATIRDARARVEQAGYFVRFGLAWDWLFEIPAVSDPPWDFLVMSEWLPLTASEFEQYASAAAPRGPRWVAFQPLSKAAYGPEARARDLVLRMLSAKVRGAPAILLRGPFDDERGLLGADGTPTELLLPWRTTADLVGGAVHLGSILLPNGSHNWLFERDGRAIMVVWNELSTDETLYLGDDVRQVTVWGEESIVPSRQDRGVTVQTIAAGPLPVFVTGLNLAVARWRLQCAIQPLRLVDASGGVQNVELRCRNTFPVSVYGSVALQASPAWDVRHEALPFELASDNELVQGFPLSLRADADSGAQRAQLDFSVSADRDYRFSVYQDLWVGSGEAALELDCWLDDSGQLVVEQRLLNNTRQPLDFNCYLYAPGRRRLRQQMLRVGPGRAAGTFVLSDGASLAGRTLWVRAEEIGGSRVLHGRITVDPQVVY